jgi:tRNA pseudouridine32 synthase/23S rRNA pseudouridine746 synthase
VCGYLEAQTQWADELAGGKMFGVLIVRTESDEIGYLAAFSGNLAHRNHHPFFVPPVFDLLHPEGYFIAEEEQISRINKQIEDIRNNRVYMELKTFIAEDTVRVKQETDNLRSEFRLAKMERDRRRQTITDKDTLAGMIRESQFQKAELKRFERRMQEYIDSLRAQLAVYEDEINRLKEERKVRSFALQRKLFDSFRILNARGEERSLFSIFEESENKLPPAGAGECAAPKLLQYAYKNQLHPLAMAEFWWKKIPESRLQQEGGGKTLTQFQYGRLAENSLRRHGYYYPACKSKCEPILTFMTQGLEIEDPPLCVKGCNQPLEITFEDEWLVVVNKPAGMLSVPGKNTAESVYSQMKRCYPDSTGPFVVHRLDMDTSGLMMMAKNELIHKKLQGMFTSRLIEKRYLAILDGIVRHDAGEISLPLCLDPEERPRQIVHYQYGKKAVTRYAVLKRANGLTLVAFYPLTGRTHQLRVHAAHPEGLNVPIKGDRLYGRPADRLYLHAESLKFTHPVTGKDMVVNTDCDFAF